jgi:hypothetical protein
MKNFVRISLIVCMLTAISCHKKSEVPTQTNNANSNAKIQFVHTAPNTIGLKMWFDNFTLQEVGNYYKSNSHYIDLAPGERRLAIKYAKTDEQLFSTNATIDAGQHYSLYACDSQGKFTGALFTDKALPTNAEKAQLRIVNVLSTTEPIHAFMNDNLIFNNVDFKTATEYKYFTPGEKLVTIQNGGRANEKMLENILVYLDPGVIYTLFINGYTNKVGTYAPDAILVVNH